MNISQITLLITRLKQSGVNFAEGLSDDEFVKIKDEFQVTFPPDLKQLLQKALPVSDRFVNWRAGLHSPEEKKQVKQRINWPLEGMLFDVENNEFWMQEWGDKPESKSQQREIAELNYQRWPKLIPVYSHRYIPSIPCEEGNPILSVYQTDIIYYGYDLASYFRQEFGLTLSDIFEEPTEPKPIDCWDYFLM